MPGFTAVGWIALSAPRNTPSDIIQKISDDLRDTLSAHALLERFESRRGRNRHDTDAGAAVYSSRREVLAICGSARRASLTITQLPEPQMTENDECDTRSSSCVAGGLECWRHGCRWPAFLRGRRFCERSRTSLAATREEIEMEHARRHGMQLKGSVFTPLEIKHQRVQANVALVHIKWNITGDHDLDGAPRAPRHRAHVLAHAARRRSQVAHSIRS